jgi:hypothetical protein
MIPSFPSFSLVPKLCLGTPAFEALLRGTVYLKQSFN